MIVSDTNLIIHFFVAAEQTRLAQQVFDADPDWVVPPIARSEAANVLATMTREGWLDTESAFKAHAIIEAFLSRATRDVSMRSALSLAVEGRITAYDAQFLVVARDLGIKLVTEDVKLRSRFPDLTRSMSAFLDDHRRGSMVREPKETYRTRRKR